MEWDIHESPPQISGDVPIDFNAPAFAGDSAKLAKEGCEFKIKITGVSGEKLTGTVTQIDQEPSEAANIRVGETVVFYWNQIHTLYRENRGSSS